MNVLSSSTRARRISPAAVTNAFSHNCLGAFGLQHRDEFRAVQHSERRRRDVQHEAVERSHGKRPAYPCGVVICTGLVSSIYIHYNLRANTPLGHYVSYWREYCKCSLYPFLNHTCSAIFFALDEVEGFKRQFSLEDTSSVSYYISWSWVLTCTTSRLRHT